MDQGQSTNPTEQRRKLLKGALGASGVITLGYSGSALASVTQCIANQNSTVPVQFSLGANPPSASSTSGSWAWKEVAVHNYKDAQGKVFDGYVVNMKVYSATYPSDFVAGATQQGNSVKTGWVLVYFDSTSKDEIGTYPQYTAPLNANGGAYAQASLICLTSLGVVTTGYTFGG